MGVFLVILCSMRLFFSVFANKISFFLIKVSDIAPNFMSVS